MGSIFLQSGGWCCIPILNRASKELLKRFTCVASALDRSRFLTALLQSSVGVKRCSAPATGLDSPTLMPLNPSNTAETSAIS